MIALGIGIATFVAFLISFAYYSVVPVPPATEVAAADQDPPSRPAIWQILIEIVRAGVTACLVAGLLVAGDWSGPASGALLGLALTALPLVLLTGSVVHEGVPIRTAAAHAGDWVIKLIVIGAVTGIFI